MTNTIITVSIPLEVYEALKDLAEEDMRSARNYIARVLIDHVPDVARQPSVKPIKSATAEQIQSKKQLTFCKECQEPVDIRYSQTLCKQCAGFK